MNHIFDNNNINTDKSDADLICDEKVTKKIEEIITDFNKKFSHVEQIKKYKLLPAEFTIEGGELTPTMKLKRKDIVNKYTKEIDGIYGR